MRKIILSTIAIFAASGDVATADKTPVIDSVHNFTSAYLGGPFPALGETSCVPPDTMGAVGPNHIVQMVNGLYTVIDKREDFVHFITDKSLDRFWMDAGVTPQNFSAERCTNAFDPRVVYDPYKERFYALSVDDALNPNNFLIAVSNTSNPIDGWTAFPVDSDPGNTRWADFPRLGMSRDHVVISGAMFRSQGMGPLREESILVIPKDDLLNGEPTVENATLIEDVGSTTGARPHPVFSLDNDSTAPILLSGNGGNVIRTNLTGASFSLSAQTITLSNEGDAPDGRQPNQATPLENPDPRFSAYPVLQNGVLWATQVVEHPDDATSAVR